MSVVRAVPRRAWLAAGVVPVLAGVVTLAASVLDAGGGGNPLPDGRAFSGTSSLSTTVPLFGDEIVAHLDIAIDRRRLDPAKLHVRTPFSPLEPVAHHTTRKDVGRITYVRKTWTLRCLSRRCAQIQPSFAAGLAGNKGTGRRATPIPPAQISFAGSPGPPATIDWPVVEWLTRINQTEAASGDSFYHANLMPPDPSYAVSPGHLLVWLLLALLVLIAVPVVLAWRRVVAYRRARAPTPEPELPPLERALRLLEWANAHRNGDDRRRALELVAVELDRAGHAELVARVRELAWRPPTPPAEDTGKLGDRVRSTVGEEDASPG